MPIELTRFYAGCCLPLFFATAWLRSNGALASRLKYNVPLSLRWRFPSIRQYWLSDVLLSAVALIAYWPLADMPGKLFETSLFAKLDADASLSHLAYPLTAVMLGLLWPQVSAVTLVMGEGDGAKHRLAARGESH